MLTEARRSYALYRSSHGGDTLCRLKLTDGSGRIFGVVEQRACRVGFAPPATRDETRSAADDHQHQRHDDRHRHHHRQPNPLIQTSEERTP